MSRGDARARRSRRAAVGQVALLLAFSGLAARAAHLSVFDERSALQGVRQHNTVLKLAAERGAIVDRQGRELALTLHSPSIYAVAGSLEDRAGAARSLGAALGRPPAQIEARLRGRDSFVFLARWVSEEQAQRVAAAKLRGVGIVREPRRVYPTGPLASQVVGFANIDGEGVRGIEQQEDGWLAGTPQRLPAQRDGSGALLLERAAHAGSTAGGDVALTLDAAMQADAHGALLAAVERTGARGGVVLTLDPRSGDVLALAEAPGFDPNHFRELPYHMTRARSFLDAVEPGSTLKAFLVAAALEAGTLDPGETIDCEQGSFRVPGKTIRDARAYGRLRPDEILRVSSNIGAVKVAFELGPRQHTAALRRFGFGESTQSGFPDESAGLLREPPPRRPVDHATLAFGQGLATTPIQLAAATAALADSGRWRRPRLVAARRTPGGDWQPTRPAPPRQAVSTETAHMLLRMLETVTSSEGTGRRAALRDVGVAGKTGTAQKFDAELGQYSNQRFVAWFVGAVPAQAPRLVVVAALDEPRRPLHTGGAAAAPLFAEVAAAQLARVGIVTAPASEAQRSPAPLVPELAEEVEVAAAPPPRAAVRRESPAPPPPPMRRPLPEVMHLAGRVLLPDLRGLTVAEVQTVTGQADLALETSGQGRAVAQDPAPGTVVDASSARVRVRFEPGSGAI